MPKVDEKSKNSLTVSWPEPRDNGSKIVNYHLEIDDSDKNFKEVYTGLANQYEVQDLQPATAYQIRVAASNAFGKR